MPTQKQLAHCLGLSVRQIGRHIAAGMPSHDAAAACDWYTKTILRAGPDREDPPVHELLHQLANLTRNAAYQVCPDSMPQRHVDAIVSIILGGAVCYAKDLGISAMNYSEVGLVGPDEVSGNLSHKEKLAADERARRRWAQRGELENMYPLL